VCVLFNRQTRTYKRSLQTQAEAALSKKQLDAGTGSSLAGASTAATAMSRELDTVGGGGEGEGDMCSICLGDLEPEELVKELRCFHCFHGECLDEWLRRNPVCPLCKAPAAAKPRLPPLRGSGDGPFDRGPGSAMGARGGAGPAPLQLPETTMGPRELRESAAAAARGTQAAARASQPPLQPPSAILYIDANEGDEVPFVLSASSHPDCLQENAFTYRLCSWVGVSAEIVPFEEKDTCGFMLFLRVNVRAGR